MRHIFITILSLLFAVTSFAAHTRTIFDNVEAFAIRWALLHSAQQEIHTQYYIVQPDKHGLAFLGMLLKKAKSGVKVSLMVDGFGSKKLTSDGTLLESSCRRWR
jgi:phosphatidylserine/phosphatidylglycerophosphate/cardiolipin synthase-like enzyme